MTCFTPEDIVFCVYILLNSNKKIISITSLGILCSLSFGERKTLQIPFTSFRNRVNDRLASLTRFINRTRTNRLKNIHSPNMLS